MAHLILAVFSLILGVSDFCEAKKSADLCSQLANYTCDLKSGLPVTDDTGTNFSGQSEGDSETYFAAAKELKKNLGSEIDSLLKTWIDAGTLQEQIIELAFKDSCAHGKASLTVACAQKFKAYVQKVATDEMLHGANEMHQKRHTNAAYHLLNDPEYGGIRDRLRNSGIDLLQKAQSEQSIKSNFDAVKATMLEVVSASFDSNTKNKLLNIVEQVQFGGTDCRINPVSGIQVYTENNAMFVPTTKKVYICNGFLSRGDSLYAMAQVLGHEIGHSIDPCNSGRTQPVAEISMPPLPKEKLIYPEFVKCLEAETSIGAKPAGLKTETKVNPADYCNHQATEATADWFGTEVLARLHAQGKLGGMTQQSLFAGLSNTFRGGCGKEKTPKNEVLIHPESKNRISKLLAAHPYFRAKLNCGAPVHQYCHPKNYSPVLINLQPPKSEGGRN